MSDHDCEICGDPADIEQLTIDEPSVWVCRDHADPNADAGDRYYDLETNR